MNSETQNKITAAQTTATNAWNWVNSNGSNMTNLRAMILKWTNNAVSTSTYIQGGWIATNTITAEKLAIGDFTNYAQLNSLTASTYGWTSVVDSTASNNPWFQKNTLARDNAISRSYTCNGGESFRVKAEISTSVKGATTNGGSSIADLQVRIGLYTINSDGSRSYMFSSGVKNSTGTISSVVTLPTNARSFIVHVQCEGWAPLSGTLKVRNVQVTRMAAGELIVDGSITAEKITTENIVGTNGWINLRSGTFNYGNGKLVWDGSNLSVSGKITATTGTIGGFTIGSSYLANGTTSLGTGSSAVYVGTNGISCGTQFKVTNGGQITAYNITLPNSGWLYANNGGGIKVNYTNSKSRHHQIILQASGMQFLDAGTNEIEDDTIGAQVVYFGINESSAAGLIRCAQYSQSSAGVPQSVSSYTNIIGGTISSGNGTYSTTITPTSVSARQVTANALKVNTTITADSYSGFWKTKSGWNNLSIDWATGSDGGWHLYFYVDNQLIYEW